jgi:FemAB-related protein (PEP-CTERM system-associated)
VTDIKVNCLGAAEASLCPDVARFVEAAGTKTLDHDPRWLTVLARGLQQTPYMLCARHGMALAGILPLSYLKGPLFGRFLVSLPYLNGGGVLAPDPRVAECLIERAIELAGDLDVRFLEFRQESPLKHPQLCESRHDKCHMRLVLPVSQDALWKQIPAKVRNQIRKGEKQGFTIEWGGPERLADFYEVFSHNMRDLGTPVYGCSLFREILTHFKSESELCVLRLGNRPVAAALLLHGSTVTEVPSASSLRKFNSTNANMFMYWQLICRAVERGNRTFDFGRSTPGSGTYRFKEQWGAKPEPSVWQYYVRRGVAQQMRPDNARFGRLIRIWRRLPVPLTRLIGPTIVRGIP